MSRIFLSIALAVFCCVSVARADVKTLTDDQKEVVSQKLNAAVEAATGWLGIVDNGKYRDSWQASAQYFQDKVPQDQWESSLRQIRPPFGKVITRETSDVKYMTYIPGAPVGEYVVIQFKTDFEDKHGSIETVTVMLEKDGSWKVSGYFIR
jgi:hypothetical protein